MEFTETQAEILVNAWALSSKGCGQVLMPSAYPDAIELAEAGWLERRSEDDGPSTWWWTPEAEAALDMNALRRDQPADLKLMATKSVELPVQVASFEC